MKITLTSFEHDYIFRRKEFTRIRQLSTECRFEESLTDSLLDFVAGVLYVDENDRL